MRNNILEYLQEIAKLQRGTLTYTMFVPTGEPAPINDKAEFERLVKAKEGSVNPANAKEEFTFIIREDQFRALMIPRNPNILQKGFVVENAGVSMGLGYMMFDNMDFLYETNFDYYSDEDMFRGTIQALAVQDYIDVLFVDGDGTIFKRILVTNGFKELATMLSDRCKSRRPWTREQYVSEIQAFYRKYPKEVVFKWSK